MIAVGACENLGKDVRRKPEDSTYQTQCFFVLKGCLDFEIIIFHSDNNVTNVVFQTTDDFFAAFEDACSNDSIDIMLKKTDKKKERFVILNQVL